MPEVRTRIIDAAQLQLIAGLLFTVDKQVGSETNPVGTRVSSTPKQWTSFANGLWDRTLMSPAKGSRSADVFIASGEV